MDLKLEGRSAIVTGGSSGIGKAIANCLAAEGVNVSLVARDAGKLERAAAEIAAATGARVLALSADTGDEAAVSEATARTAEMFGGIDILVNCAARVGSQIKAPGYADVTGEQLWREIDVKVLGYLRAARAAVPYMRQAGSGRIINISGLAARSTGNIVGSIRNVGVAAMTKNLADELAPMGITAVCVHPGPTRTEGTAERIRRAADAEKVEVDVIERKLSSRNLLGRMVTAEEIGHLVTFLASPKSLAVNGDVVIAGGGIPGSIYY